jgi:hypothetical protein
VIEKKNLVGFGDGIAATQVTHIHPTVGEDQAGCFRELLLAPVTALARADDVTQCEGVGLQQKLS